jgi:phosphoglycerate dehydrogenase-like enzyme
MTHRILMTSMGGRNGEIAGLLEKGGCEVVLVPRPEPPGQPHVPSAEEIERFWRTADGFVMSGRDLVTREALEGAPNLKVGVSPIIGTENIDVPAATELGIVIGYGAVPENLLGVAEAVVMLTAALIKRLPAKWAAVREGGFRVDDPGHMVRNSTIGLIGFGNIGRGVARRLQGWETNVIVADPYVQAAAVEEHGARLVDLDTLLRTADVVSISVVLNDETRHMLSDREFGLIKPGAYIINTSRGPCIDEAAMIRALDSGRLGGIAIDTWEQEPTNLENPLRDHPKVIATGHNIGHSHEVYAALGPAAAENVLRPLRGEPPLYFRNPEALPKFRERMARLGVNVAP